jgi:CheY-like chemotaxis protein
VPELIQRLARETKIQILVGEALTSDFATSELAELLGLLAAGPSEKAALSVAILETLVASGTPAGRIEDLRKAFGAPAGTGRVPKPASAPTRLPAEDAPNKAAATQQTRPVQSPFRVRFDAGQPAPVPAPEPGPALEPAAPVAPAAAKPPVPSPPAAPRAPLPLRGKAASILKGGTGVLPAPAPAAAPPRVANEPVKSSEVFFGDGKGKPTPEAVRGTTVARPTVLVADDDKRIRMVFRLKLEEQGFTVVEAADGQEAWKRLELGGIAAVVLDMKMPGLHGLEILSRLADTGKILPVVVCTAYDRLDDEFVVATYPKLRYLTKPVDAAHLAETVSNLLADGA